MLPGKRPPLKRYALAAACVFVASLLTLPLESFFGGKAPSFFFIVAVVVASVYGGVGPGLFATALSTSVILAFFRLQLMLLAVAHSGIIVFAALGIAVSLILGWFQKASLATILANRQLEIANRKLRRRGEDLIRANEELQRFAYALAHDLNAPLRNISALTDLLVRRNLEKLDDSSKECAGMIVSRVQRLQSMIKGLLEYASVVEKPEQRALVNSNVIVQRAIQDLDAAIQECAAEITVDPLPPVRATESHLEQVFSNLISNAVKYRPRVRQPRVHISAVEEADEWCFCVSDNGIGLDMKYAEEIFGMFRRLHGENQYEGNGIGLALCRIVIERHGGRIWVESELGKGCRFFFTLPKAPHGADRTAAGPSPISV